MTTSRVMETTSTEQRSKPSPCAFWMVSPTSSIGSSTMHSGLSQVMFTTVVDSVDCTGKYASPGLRHSEPPGSVVGAPTVTLTVLIDAPPGSGRLPRLALWLAMAVSSKSTGLETPSTTCVSSPTAE